MRDRITISRDLLTDTFGISEETIEESFNSTSVLTRMIESDMFRKTAGRNGGDFRTLTLSKLEALHVPFNSTCNNVTEAVRRYIKVECIYCGDEMEPKGGGGNGSVMTTTLRCPKCRSEFSITMPHDGISVSPPVDSALRVWYQIEVGMFLRTGYLDPKEHLGLPFASGRYRIAGVSHEDGRLIVDWERRNKLSSDWVQKASMMNKSYDGSMAARLLGALSDVDPDRTFG